MSERNLSHERNAGANLIMDANAASILKSMKPNNADIDAAKTLSMMGEGSMNSRRNSPTTHSINSILSGSHSINSILKKDNYPPFNPYDPPASLYGDINPRIKKGGMDRSGSVISSTVPNPSANPVKFVSDVPLNFNLGIKKSSRGGIQKPVPRRVLELRKGNKTQSAERGGGGRRRGTKRRRGGGRRRGTKRRRGTRGCKSRSRR